MRSDPHPTDPRPIIRELAEARGFRSVRALAIAAGVTQPTLNRYLTGVTEDMELRHFRAIAATLDVTLSQLLGETPLFADPRISTVMHAMERMPDSGKNMLAAAATALATPGTSTPAAPYVVQPEKKP